MSQYDGSPIYKVVIMCQKDSQLDEARKLLSKDFDFVIQEVKAYSCLNGELINKKFNKGLGVKIIAEKFGVDIKDTFGFGDSWNQRLYGERCGSSEKTL